MLPKAPRLGTFTAKNRAEGKDFDRLGPVAEAVFDIGPHQPGGEFGTQGDRRAVLFLDGVHFFLHEEVGSGPDAAGKEVGRLNDRDGDGLEAGLLGQAGRGGHNVVPVAMILREDVLHPLHALNGAHGCLSWWPRGCGTWKAAAHSGGKPIIASDGEMETGRNCQARRTSHASRTAQRRQRAGDS